MPREETVAGVKITNADRVVYRLMRNGEEHALTKGDVARFVEKTAPLMLPHVQHRPLTIVRCRAGSDGPSFFQKHAMKGMPAAIDTLEVIERKGKTTALAVHDAAGLVGLVQMSALEFHVWSSRDGDLSRPDRVIIDLDPDEQLPWSRVVEGAQHARRLFARDGLESFVKTTGGKGLHVVAPLRGADGDAASDDAPWAAWERAFAYTEKVADAMMRDEPERYTTNMKKALRPGKIFLDFGRNMPGATTIAPWSTRQRGTLSVPVAWDELPDVRGSTWTLLDLDARLAQRADPWARFFTVQQRLPA